MNVGALKIGSTTLSYLVAEDLDRPIIRETVVVNLIARPDAPNVLLKTVSDWLSAFNPRPDRLLMAGGQVFRENPEWARSLSLPVWELTGAEEGQVTRMAILSSTRTDIGLLIDIGGGSTEISDSRDSHSLPIGVHRPVLEATRWPRLGSSDRAIVVGGAGHALAVLLHREVMQPIFLNELQRLRSIVAERGLAWLQAQGISQDRLALVVPGLDILYAICNHYHVNQLVWSHYGLLEGIWLAASLGRGRPWAL